jgi:hypothetical protein
MSDSRFSSRGVGSSGGTSAAGFLRTVNLSDAIALLAASYREAEGGDERAECAKGLMRQRR